MKYTLEEVKEFIENKNWKLISKEYTSKKIELLCPKNHSVYKTFKAFKRNSGCQECNGSKKFTTKYIREQFEKEGWKLITDSYHGIKQKLEVICP